MPSINLSSKARTVIAVLVGVILFCAAVYLHYHPLDDNFSGFTYYRGTTSQREYVNLPPSATQSVTLIETFAVVYDAKKLGPEPFKFPLDTGYFYLLPYDHSEIIIQIYEGGGQAPAVELSGIYKVRSSLLYEKCKYQLQCSWPGLYVFYDNGDTEFLKMTEKQYIVITTKQRR